MPNDRIEEFHVIAALATRRATADGNAREALRRLSTGSLRRFRTGTSDPLTDALRDILDVDEKAQCTQRIVDWYLRGRRDNPPFPERPQMRAAMETLYRQQTGESATDTELDVLVNALAGAEADIVMVPSPLKRMIIARALVDAFVDGAD